MALPAQSVVCDVQGAQNPSHRDRGIARYTVEQLRAVRRLAPDAIRSVALNPALPLPGSLDFLVGSGLLEWTDPRRPPSDAPPLWHVMSPMELDRPIDDLWPAWARTGRTRLVVTLYDLIPLIFADHYLGTPLAHTRYLARANLIRAAHHVLAISETTAADAVEHLGVRPERITVIDAGVAAHFADAHATPESARSVLAERLGVVRDDFLLYVGGIEWRKNIERLIAGYALVDPAVRARHQLVIACRVIDPDRRALEAHAAALGIAPGEFVLTGYVTDAELAALYARCRLFVFPSIYEGSGLPILEAMSLGAPIAASKGSTSPEILGDDEATFDPYDVDDIRRVLQATATDDALLERLRARSARRVGRYTWEHVGARTLEAYERTLADAPARPRRSARRRPRIAWVSPWPPERSGVATYSGRLVEALHDAAGLDVDVLVGEPLETFAEPSRAGIRLLPARALGTLGALRDYDDVVYSMGNSSFHGFVMDALRRRPGTVLLHDVRLVGFYTWLAQREEPGDPWPHLAHLIGGMYGDRLDAEQFAGGPPSPAEQEAQGLYMTHDVQRAAERIIVHSRYAADVVRLDRPAGLGHGPPVDVVPHAFLPRADADAGHDREAELIVSLGGLSAVKGLATLIDAFAILRRARPGLRLVLPGPALEGELDRWREHARRAGVGDAVDIPGWTSEAEYERLLRTASIAMQLRTSSNGEASGTIVDALGAGLPTILTAHGWAAELPAEASCGVEGAISPTALARTLDALLDDAPRRARMAAAGLALARRDGFDAVAREIAAGLAA